MRRFLFACVALIVTALPARAEPLKVVASFSILGDLGRNFGGTSVEVTTLVGPDSDAHVYSPTPADAKKIADARLIVVNGLGFEGWLPRLGQSSRSKATIVPASNGIPPLRIGNDADPHAWQSVNNAKIYVANISAALASADPASADQLMANTQAYLAKLDALDREVRDAVAKLP